MTLHNLLNFSRVEMKLNEEKTEATLIIWFVKPKQQSYNYEDGSIYTEKIVKKFTIPQLTNVYDYNQKSQAASTLTADGLDLYFAVYWDKEKSESPALCISVLPIEPDWHVTPEITDIG